MGDFVSDSELKKVLKESSDRRKGFSSRYELNIDRQNSSQINTLISAAPWMNEDGEFQGAIGLMIDKTEQKRIENALNESEERFRTIIDACKDGMITIDRNGLITLLNPVTEEIFGYQSDELIGEPPDRLIPDEYRI